MKPLAYDCHLLQLCYCIKNPPNMALIIYSTKFFIVYTGVLYISVLQVYLKILNCFILI
jgi:hypothetical protein